VVGVEFTDDDGGELAAGFFAAFEHPVSASAGTSIETSTQRSGVSRGDRAATPSTLVV
jgi:hypothetical protein